jgi:hypothetical protein
MAASSKHERVRARASCVGGDMQGKGSHSGEGLATVAATVAKDLRTYLQVVAAQRDPVGERS